MEGQRFETRRVKLADQLPLATPFSVTIVPSSYCTFACTFCPARLLESPSLMTFGNAKVIMDNANFPDKVKMLSLYNVGEPLLCMDLAEIIRYGKKSGFAERVSIVTNASMLSAYRSEQLIHSGIDRIIISIYGLSNQDYSTNTHRNVNAKDIFNNIKYLYKISPSTCQIHVKVIDRVVRTLFRMRKFIDIFENYCTSYSVEPILPIWPNFRPEGEDPALANVGLYRGIPAVDRIACHYPFYSMVVTARGLVTPCLADWDETLVLGDAMRGSLNAIWNSDVYQALRLTQLLGRRKELSLCRTCGTLRAATCPEDDIDGSRMMLLEKLFPKVYQSHSENP